MPKAVLDLSETQRYDLKTLPEGYVVLRRMTYGQKLQRQQMAMSIAMQGSSEKDFSGQLAMASDKVAEFEFASCIVEHNLEDAAGKQLDFKLPANVQNLHPQIGEEIGTYIDKMNTFEETPEAKN